MSSSRCVSRARSVVIYGSFVLAVAGWGVAVLGWVAHGREAGVLPGFIMALTMAATFTTTLAVTIVLPDKARMHALGFSEGVKWMDAHRGDPEPGARESHLRAVR